MLVYILKSSACLAVFLVFYKLFLEKESIHIFKRFYLIFGIVIAFSIPFITFTEYVEVSTEIQSVTIKNLTVNPNIQTNYLAIILWSIYGLGVITFGIKFIFNLTRILNKIKQNPKHKYGEFTNVLLVNLLIPHTFFNYIFLNKGKFEAHQIPEEVLLHEQTHAIQKHSLDILFIEILQTIFWFNPLLYFIKKDIKLNHEFLADQAVLSKGYNTANYQNTLLAFSSDALQPQLANAINYSLIKKRFTVMKTQTSKKAIWIRSLILLPLLGITLYSFSDKVIIEKEKINSGELEVTTLQEKATQKQVAEYNTLVKKYNEQSKEEIVITLKDLERLKYLYHVMSVNQRKNAEPFPDVPPPPPAPNTPDAPKVIEGKIVPSASPPPPPIPENATKAQKKKYEETIQNYEFRKQNAKLRKIKRDELNRVRELPSIENKKRVKAEKEKLIKVRKLRYDENKERVKTEKLTYRETQIAARADKRKVEKGELIKVRERRAAEDRKQSQEAKLAYRKAQVAARADKIKVEKQELTRARELQFKEQRELKKKLYEDLKNKVKDQRKYSQEEINKMAKAEKKAYKKSQRKEKALKKKSKKKEN